MHLARALRFGSLFAALAGAAGIAAAANVTISPVPANGRVASSPAGLNCGNGATACTAAFPNGSTLQLTAIAGTPLTRFKEWRVTIGGSTGTSTAHPLLQTVPSVNATVEVVFVTIPGPPTMGGATAGNASATVSFKPPATSGSSPITSYTVTSTPGSVTATGPGSPITVTGLTNGTTYTFTVRANSAAGAGLPSAQSNAVTPRGPPGQIPAVTAVPRYVGVEMYWFATPEDNGSPILDYTATCNPGGFSNSSTTSPISIDGPQFGQTYNCSVSARNALGSGPPRSSGDFLLRPPGRFVSPLPPDGYVGKPYSHTFVVEDCAPNCHIGLGGEPPPPGLTMPNSLGSTKTMSGTPTVRGIYPYAVSAGFDNPTIRGYPFQEFTLTIYALPGAPVIGTATPGNASASVSFSPPADDGGKPITGYTVTASPGGASASGPASPITVTGLANGTAYTFSVRAANAGGLGAASAASNPVTPMGPTTVPGAPTNVTAVAGSASASVSFSAPASSGGTPITSYTVTSNPGGVIANGAASPIVVGGLTNGTQYTFTVRANNAVGTGPASSASNSVTPRAAVGVPEAPVIRRAIAGDGRATLEFAARGDGGSAITTYFASCNPGNRTAIATASPLVLVGLANGQSYSCTVTAVNAIGNGPPSAVFSVTPAGPRFPITVQANITPTSASATATFSPAPEDAGRTANVYVFAIAPSTLVANAMPGSLSWEPHGAKAGAVQCVLAQLATNGQLQGASISSLQAAISNVVLGQAQAVTLLSNVPTPNVSGATFYVGYGETSGAMIVNGVTSNALTVPGPVTCQPQPPQTGWWWNPAEDGRGFSIEVRGNHLFFAAFLYDASGRSTWYVSSGAVSVDGSLYSGDLYGARGGQTLGGPYLGRPELVNEGPITLAFHTADEGTLVWAGGVVPIQRFNIVPDGLVRDPVPGTPESGWWWNEQESGRGFFLEWQAGTLDIAGYMYDDQGNSVWYLTVGDMATRGGNFFTGSWWSYGNGQTLTGAWKPNARLSTTVAPMTITFSGPDTALMTLPNGRTTTLRRHRF